MFSNNTKELRFDQRAPVSGLYRSIALEMKLNAFEVELFQDRRKLNDDELIINILKPARMDRVEIYKRPKEYEAEIKALMKVTGMDRRICVRCYNCHIFNYQKALRNLSSE
jgi:hypothetical protein